MRVIKYLMIGAFMLGFAVPTIAQNEDKATIDQVNKIIKSKSPDAANQIKEIYKKNKKNPAVLTAIGRAYLDVKDTANASKFIQFAMEKGKQYGPAYILAGDLEVIKDNGGAASAWYEQATYFDPKNPEGYRKYAQINSKTSPSASVAKLEELRRQRPDYPVDVISAQIYDKAGNIKKAIEYYAKVDRSKLEDNDLVSYALDHFLLGEFDKSLELSQYGNQKFPRNPALNRLSFFNLTNLKKYPEALSYADKLFNQSDSTKITQSDYLYYGYAYMGNKEYQKAIDMFNQSLANNENNASDKSDALKNIASCYSEMGDINKAAETFDQYLKSLKTINATDYNELAKMWMNQAERTTGDAQKEAYAKADAVYADMAEKFPNAADFATYYRAHIGFALDPETKLGTAKPHYEKLIEIIKSHTEKGDYDDNRLIEAYQYLGYYYTLQKDKAKANSYWNAILEIDPENATAKAALGKK